MWDVIFRSTQGDIVALVNYHDDGCWRETFVTDPNHPVFERHHDVGELSKETLATISSSRMAPEHAHLNALLDD